MYENLAILAIVAFLYSVISSTPERTSFGGAIAFTTAGLALGSPGLGILKLNFSTEPLSVFAELTLALVLFTDAANVDLTELAQSVSLPRGLLLIGLPITILCGFSELARRREQECELIDLHCEAAVCFGSSARTNRLATLTDIPSLADVVGDNFWVDTTRRPSSAIGDEVNFAGMSRDAERLVSAYALVCGPETAN